MTLTCKGYRATVISTGEIRLEIESPQADQIQDKLSMSEIALLLEKSVKSIDRLSRRRRNPLPLHRGKGRPYGLRYEINKWLIEDNRYPIGIGDPSVPIFGYNRHIGLQLP